MYQNEGLNEINKKYPDIDFSKLDGKVVVPVGAICDKLNIDIKFIDLEDGHAGYFDHTQNTIFVNEKYPATRNLFTVAHETGHFILHAGSNNRFDEYHKYTPDERKREYEANAFAGKLLMPENKFVEVFKKYKGFFPKIADIFGVSVRACEVRAFNLGLIDNV